MTVKASHVGCAHEVVDASSLMPGPGGQVHEVGHCALCGEMLRRLSPLHPWTPVDQDNS